MISEAYRQTKAGGGKLKLRALALLAEGGDEAAFEAATLLREAARAEERALRLLPIADPETRLGVAVECCGCLVDARAPRAAALAWGDVLRASEGLPDKTLRAHRAKLDPKVASLERDHERALAATPTLNAAHFLWPAVADKARAQKELDILLARFPGEVELWYTRYQASFFDKDYAAAWSALEKARALDPGKLFVLGAELLLAPRVLPVAAAEARLDAAYSMIRRAGVELDADVCLCFGIASFQLAEKSERR
jgi:tetratricopeptide (TPR) repeat protein